MPAPATVPTVPNRTITTPGHGVDARSPTRIASAVIARTTRMRTARPASEPSYPTSTERAIAWIAISTAIVEPGAAGPLGRRGLPYLRGW